MLRIAIFLLLLLPDVASTQPFASEIQAFKKRDSLNFPPQKAILFVGSSSFAMWQDVADYFPQHQIINRGFGGSSLPDLIRYESEIIFPYQPKQIVIYCGENDLAANDSLTGEQVYQRFVQLFTDIRRQLPKTHLVYISMKPSPSRLHLLQKMKDGNTRIRKFLQSKRRTAFVDIFTPMLKPDGKPNENLFLDDMLHMNKSGYQLWKPAIEKHLLR
jgi:lysophospholipase L1-like esterase